MYRTEDLVNPHASVQAAAVAALCFIPVVAAQPQLLLPLMLTFLGFLLFVRSHKPALLLIPLPAAFVCAPTLVNAVRFASDGTWRQLFGSVMLPPPRMMANRSSRICLICCCGCSASAPTVAHGGMWRFPYWR